MTSAMSFSVVLRGARRAAGLTQDGLAHSAGVGLRTVQELERGSAQPRRETLRRLCAALAVPFEEWAPFVAGGRRRKHVGLPAVRTSFVGREPELRDGLARLSAVRLLTLVGPGGVGKTRLARELVNRTSADWVAWVELNGQATVSPLATLASQLRLAGGGARPRLRRLRTRARRVRRGRRGAPRSVPVVARRLHEQDAAPHVRRGSAPVGAARAARAGRPVRGDRLVGRRAALPRAKRAGERPARADGGERPARRGDLS